MQDYLVNENMSNRHKQLAFKLRTRMGKFDRNSGKKGPCLTCKIPGTDVMSLYFLEKYQRYIAPNSCTSTPSLGETNTI